MENIFSLEAPYCDVDLSPKWDYDFEKAVLLSCGGTLSSSLGSSLSADNDDDNQALAWGLGIELGLLVIIVVGVAFSLYQKGQKLQAELDGIERKDAAVDPEAARLPLHPIYVKRT